MIEFIGFTPEKNGISFRSSFTEDKKVTLLVSDGYTGLNLWKDKITISPGGNYFFSSGIFSAERQFEVFDEEEQEKLFSIFIKLKDQVSIEDLDQFGILKSYHYPSKERASGNAVLEIFIKKDYEEGEVKVQEGDIVFDIGANIGLFSLYSIYQKAKEVHSFEPGIDQFNSIKQNLCNEFDNIQANNLAVTKNKGTVRFYVNEDASVTNSTFSSELSNKYIEVESIDIETYFNSLNIQKIDYLKIDCEGGEYEIIEFADEKFLEEKVDKICLEFHIFKDDDNSRLEDLINKLKKSGFDVRKKENMLFCKNNRY
jgi:FkbM family methyltransferase